MAKAKSDDTKPVEDTATSLPPTKELEEAAVVKTEAAVVKTEAAVVKTEAAKPQDLYAMLQDQQKTLNTLNDNVVLLAGICIELLEIGQKTVDPAKTNLMDGTRSYLQTRISQLKTLKH